jgi:serine/threonine protein kinase
MLMSTVVKGNSIEIDVVRSALSPEYELLEELGRGGMAIVYRARERDLDREVAIKVLPAMLAMDQDFVERFTHEARTAGKLEHPNIVPIYRVGVAGQVTYFVMKLLPGQSLSRVLRERGKLSVGEVRRILIECASALGYAAKRNVVHRDIKPDNILLDGEGRCVITDFGIAKAPGGAQTAAGTSLGTPRYMSPEHAQGVPLDGRSDMYSLGVVAYQCLIGKIPYDADDPFAILYKHINEPVPRPELSSDEEWSLFHVIERMLSKKAEDRFQSADDLIVALGGHVSAPTLVSTTMPGLLVAAQPTEIIPTPTYGTRIRRFATQDWRSWAGMSAIAVAAMFVFMITRPRLTQSDTPAPAANVPATKAAAPIGASTGAASTTAATNRTDSAARVAGSTTGATASKSSPRPGGTKSVPAGATPAAPRNPASVASKCPARPTAFSVRLDSVPPQRAGATIPVQYHVCGLPAGSNFSATIRFRRQGRNNNTPIVRPFPDQAASNREGRRRIIDLAPLSPGRYYIDLIVVDGNGVDRGETRDFQLLDRR